MCGERKVVGKKCCCHLGAGAEGEKQAEKVQTLAM